ncbi:MAG: HEAT repeat domain-containing protein, partial [Pirellulales bacterium]
GNRADAAPDVNLPPLNWLDGLEAGQRAGQLNNLPLLVSCGSASCVWCQRLEVQLADNSLRAELKRWTLVYIDAEKAPAVADQLEITGVPALRILTPRGTTTASRDGFMTAVEVKAWLTANYDEAMSQPEEVLFSADPPNEQQISKLLVFLSDRDASTREAAIRRLAAHRTLTADPVVASFVEGKLATRLAALEILLDWHAPIEQLDPWEPKSLSEERLARLEAWTAQKSDDQSAVEQSKPLDGEELKDAQAAIRRLQTANNDDVSVIYGRLARYGTSLLPEVYRQLKAVESDQARQRLTALRYHLVASPRLVLNWQQGLIALSVADVAERRAAADQLVRRATGDDEALLLELFAHPDSLVRELSLRGLQEIGGANSTKSLVQLLKDPEANVRAAVLKQLTEKPTPAMVSHVAEYVAAEKDADLVVHAVRFLREANNPAAIEAMLGLVDHESWQVRAEVAEGLATVAGSGSNAKSKPGVYQALTKLLGDEDGFVVSHAMKGVAEMQDAPVATLVAIVEQHPELANDAVNMMAGRTKSKRSALPHLRRFTKHESSTVRAAALNGVYQLAPSKMQEELLAGLDDENSQVRMAAAAIVFQVHEKLRNDRLSRAENERNGSTDARFSRTTPQKPLLGRFFDLFGGSGEQPPTLEPLDAGEVPAVQETTSEGEDATNAAEQAAEEPASDSTAKEPLKEKEEAVEPAAQATPEQTTTPEEAAQKAADAAVKEAANDVQVEPVKEQEPDPLFADEDEDAKTTRDERTKGSENDRPADTPVENPAEEKPAAADGKATGDPPTAVRSEPATKNGVKDELKDGAKGVATGVAIDDAGDDEKVPRRSTMAVWVDEYRAGKNRDQWLEATREPLNKMLESAQGEERMAAVVALVPFGQHDEEAVQLASLVVREQSEWAQGLSAALPWLPWKERLAVFHSLNQLPLEGYLLGHLAKQLNATPVDGAVDEMWALFAHDDMNVNAAYALVDTLRETYFGENHYSPSSYTPAQRKQAADASRKYLASDNEWQQTVAMVMLVSVAQEEAVKAAASILDDKQKSSQLREDALRILFLTQSPSDRTATAIRALDTKDRLLAETSLAMLASGPDAVSQVRNYISVQQQRDINTNYNSGGKPIVPKAPSGLTIESVRPFLESEDAKVAAYAGYLATLLDETSGLDALIRQWRSEERSAWDDAWSKLVYRAIAHSNDSEQVPVLREIYQVYRKGDATHQIKEFYWTIRIMDGAEILRLRKQIRANVGMSNLK